MLWKIGTSEIHSHSEGSGADDDDYDDHSMHLFDQQKHMQIVTIFKFFDL